MKPPDSSPARLRHRGRTVYVWRADPVPMPAGAPAGASLGTVVQSRTVTIATGADALAIVEAWRTKPLPRPWPGWDAGLRDGERVG